MGSNKVLLMLSSKGAPLSHLFTNANRSSCFSFPKVTRSVTIHHKLLFKFWRFSSMTTHSSIQPPDVTHLVKTAQISTTPDEIEEFAPKIQQVIDWFGKLQSVDLQSIEPSIRAESEKNLRENAPETFDNKDAILASVPTYEEPYIKVPRVLSMD